MIDENENTYDSGTITFTGNAASGTYTEMNFYDVAYEGTYTVTGQTVKLAGDETWSGAFKNATHLHGIWKHPDDGESGFWEAQKIK